MRISRAPEGRESGFALVVVLWFLVLLAAFVGPFALAARTSAMITANELEKNRLDLLADGLTSIVADRLAENPKLADALALNGQAIDCAIGQSMISFNIQDQTGLIDLNAADGATLALGLASLGIDQEATPALSEAIIAYRSFAASAGDLSSTFRVTGGLKRAPFESVAELTDFEPLANVTMEKLHATFTVHSGTGMINRAVAPEHLAPLVHSFPGEAGQTPGSSRQAINVFVRHRATGTAGYAGYIVEPSAGEKGTFRRVEALISATSEGGAGRRLGCPGWLARDIASLVGDVAI